MMTPIEAHCPKCGYDWITKSEMYSVNCPRCRKLVWIREKPTEVKHD